MNTNQAFEAIELSDEQLLQVVGGCKKGKKKNGKKHGKKNGKKNG